MQTPVNAKQDVKADSAAAKAPSDPKAKPPAPSAREAQVASVFDSCIPGGMYTQPAIQPPR
jgi:hypothetical protein